MENKLVMGWYRKIRGHFCLEVCPDFLGGAGLTLSLLVLGFPTSKSGK